VRARNSVLESNISLHHVSSVYVTIHRGKRHAPSGIAETEHGLNDLSEVHDLSSGTREMHFKQQRMHKIILCCLDLKLEFKIFNPALRCTCARFFSREDSFYGTMTVWRGVFWRKLYPSTKDPHRTNFRFVRGHGVATVTVCSVSICWRP
jgi:hypothetical protein